MDTTIDIVDFFVCASTVDGTAVGKNVGQMTVNTFICCSGYTDITQ